MPGLILLKPSCNVDFKTIPENATFPTPIINLGLKIGAILMVNFPVDCP